MDQSSTNRRLTLTFIVDSIWLDLTMFCYTSELHQFDLFFIMTKAV